MVTVQATSSVYVNGQNSTTQAKNYSSAATFRAGTSPQIISYLYFNRPFPLGATITDAYIEITQSQPTTDGTREVDLRRVDQKWEYSKVNHNNRPGVTATTTSTSLGNGPRGRVWTIDATAQMQEVADGAPWYGFRVYTDKADAIHFFNHKSAEFGPRLVVEYSMAPQTPTGLTPAGGLAVSVARPTLTCGYSSADSSALVAIHVQMNEDTADFTTPDHDSGEVASTLPQYVVPFDVEAAEVWFWRARVKNASGEWSGWSDPAEFTRAAKGVAALTVPADAPNNVIHDVTPTFGHSFSGTQKLFRYIVTEKATGLVLWDTFDIAGADTSITYPDDAPRLQFGPTYTVRVRVTDDKSRVATAGDPIWVEVEKDFTVAYEDSVTGAYDLVASNRPGDPRVTLAFKRSSTPDAWLFLRDGVVVDRVPGPDLLVDGITYEWTDLAVAAGNHTWTVAAVVNGETSEDNVDVSKIVTVKGVWLITDDGEHAVCLYGDKPRRQPQELSTVHLPLGATNPVLITQAIFGARGNDGGDLSLGARDDSTLANEVAHWDAITNPIQYPRGTVLSMVWSDTSVRAFLFNTMRDAETEFIESIPVAFEFCEVR